MKNLNGLFGQLERLERLERKVDPPKYVSLWDVLWGAVPMPEDLSLIDPRHRPMLEALMTPMEDPPDLIEAEIAKLGGESPAPAPGTNGHLNGVNGQRPDQGPGHE
jgi:hypothetical protein